MSALSGRELLSSILGDESGAPTGAIAGPTVRFTIKRFVLQVLLDKASTVVPTRDVMPVLKNFLIEAGDGGLRVTATDMERSLIASVRMVTVEQPGAAVFPARKLLEMVRSAKDAEVEIEVKNFVAAIRIGPTQWNLKLQTGADYPVMPQFSDTVFFTVNRTEFATALAAVRYAVSKDANRANLMMIDVRDGKMTGCDGSRFQQARTASFPFDLRIPIGAVEDLLRLLKAIDLDTIDVGQSVNHLIFRLGPDIFLVNKLVAQFPDMEAMLLRPALENKHQLSLNRSDLIDAVKRVRINADSTTSAIALILDPGKVTVAARDSVGNEATEAITASWNRPTRTLVVNHGYLMELINNHTGRDDLHFKLGDDTPTRRAPLLLTAGGNDQVGVVQQMLLDWTS